MWEIILKMLLCLIIAFILGFIVGWLLRGLFCKEKEAKLQADIDERDDKLRGFRANASAANASATTNLGVAAAAVTAPAVDASFDADYSAIRARLDELESLATDDDAALQALSCLGTSGATCCTTPDARLPRWWG